MAISFEKIFRVNQRLEVMLSKRSNDQHYTSRIEELISNHMIIAMPMEKGSPVFHARGSVFYGKVYHESGVYSFKSIFVDKKMTPLPIWIVTMPFDVKKNQQRSFVRFEVALPLVVEYLEYEDEEQDEERARRISLKLITKDLSAGGLQIISNQIIKAGKKVHLTLQLPEYGAFEIDGEVVRNYQPQAERQLFWIGIRFSNVAENIRDKISKFIFRKQLEQRQKGL